MPDIDVAGAQMRRTHQFNSGQFLSALEVGVFKLKFVFRS